MEQAGDTPDYKQGAIGGDVAASAIANTYYPASNRGVLVATQGVLMTTSGRMVNSLIQEFLLRRLRPGMRDRAD